MPSRDIKYIGRDFESLRTQLMEYAKAYFPDSYKDFNETSPGMMLIEMSAYVGDILSYYIDNRFNEIILDNVRERKNAIKLANMYGYKAKPATTAETTLSVYQTVPATGSVDATTPDMNFALIVNRGMRVQSAQDSDVSFETIEDVNFTVSSSYDPTEITVFEVDGSNVPQTYVLKKFVKAQSGITEAVTETVGTATAFKKVKVPYTDVTEIISVTDSNSNTWYEVDYLAQATIFEAVQNTVANDPEFHSQVGAPRYLLKLKRVPRRFITETDDTGYTYLIFGAGIEESPDEEILPNPEAVTDALGNMNLNSSFDPSNFLKTRTFGIAPSNTTLTINYRRGGGVSTNVPTNDLNTITSKSYTFDATGLDVTDVQTSKNSLAANNEIPGRGGRDAEPIWQIKERAKSAFAEQRRCVTKEDYIIRAYSLPSKFGEISKAYVNQEDFLEQGTIENEVTGQDKTVTAIIPNPLALDMYLLGFDNNKKLTQASLTLKTNLKTYLSQYRMLTDTINIKDGHIINIGVKFDITVFRDYNKREVVLRCVEKIKNYFNIDKWQFNQPIIMSDLIYNMLEVDGIQSVADVYIVNKYNVADGYSGNFYDIFNESSGQWGSAYKDGLVFCSADVSIFELRHANRDIEGRAL